MKYAGLLTLLVGTATALSAGHAGAAPIRLQPDEAASKDVFVYAFEIPGTLGVPSSPHVTNFDDTTVDAIDPDPVLPFGEFLGSAKTDPFTIPPSPQLREHTARTLIEFDLASLALNPDQVAKATLNLFAVDAFPPFENPTPAEPVTIELRRVLEDWNEQTVTWVTQPDAEADLFATAVQTGANQLVSFDITGLVAAWLADPASNFGVQLAQQNVVDVPQGPGERDRYRASVYASSAMADPGIRPYLEVTPIPVPAPLLLLASGAALLFGVGRARRQRQA